MRHKWRLNIILKLHTHGYKEQKRETRNMHSSVVRGLLRPWWSTVKGVVKVRTINFKFQLYFHFIQPITNAGLFLSHFLCVPINRLHLAFDLSKLMYKYTLPDTQQDALSIQNRNKIYKFYTSTWLIETTLNHLLP